MIQFYLAFPLLLFFLTHLKIPWAILFSFTLLLGLKNSFTQKVKRYLSYKHIVVLFFILLVWCFLGGMGGFFFQNGDYQKHYQIFFDLAKNPWPVRYDLIYYDYPPIITNLMYYTAYYLPASFLASLTSLKYIGVYQLIWTLMGLMLAFHQLSSRIQKKRYFLFILFFIFASGLDILGFLVTKERLPYWGEHIEFWFPQIQFSSITTLLFWVPQHFIPALLFFSLMMSQEKIHEENLNFTSVLTLFWSPFVFLSTLVFISYRKTIKHIPSLFIGSFFIAYYSSKVSGEKIEFISPSFVLLLFFFLEAFIFYLLSKKDFLAKKSIFFLFLLCFVKIGYFNDLAMRTSILFLMVLFFQFFQKNKKTLVFSLIFLIGMMNPFQEIYRSISRKKSAYSHKYYLSIPKQKPHFIKQYLSRKNHWFNQMFLKENNIKNFHPITKEQYTVLHE